MGKRKENQKEIVILEENGEGKKRQKNKMYVTHPKGSMECTISRTPMRQEVGHTGAAAG